MADRWMDERDRQWRERDWRRAESLDRGEADRGWTGRSWDHDEDRSWAGVDQDDDRYQDQRRRSGAYGGDAPDYGARSRIVHGGPQAYGGPDDDYARSYRADREARRAYRDPEHDYDDYFQRSRVGGGHGEDRGYGEDFRQAARGHRGRGPKGYRRSDERISEDVHDRLTDDPWLDATDIEVTVKAGEVTLSGQVDSREGKHRAERLVEDLSGVRHVQNNLRVDPNAGFTGGGRGFGSSALEAEMRRNELATSPGEQGVSGLSGRTSTGAEAERSSGMAAEPKKPS